MTLEQFRQLAESWGGNVERWPDAQRAAAHQLAATAEGAEILDDARRLDRLLALPPAVNEDRAAAAAFAVVQRLATEGDRNASRWSLWRRARWRQSWLLPAASLACSAVVGVSLAASLPFGQPQQEAAVMLGMILDSGSMATTWVLQ